MLVNITNYFTNLNNAGQALFIVGVLLVITFIILLIVVLKPEKNKVKKIYGESEVTDREIAFEEKMKDIDNVGLNDINLENDRTRNLKSIVDELKLVESKNNASVMDKIQEYEDEQEDTAIISVEELLKSNKPVTYAKRETYERPIRYNEPVKIEKTKEEVKSKVDDDFLLIDEEDYKTGKITIPRETEVKKYTPKREIFSSVYTEPNKKANEEYLNSLKEFRSNL